MPFTNNCAPSQPCALPLPPM